jgi:dipeptidyl aminopeptidase/acylaminoacyl peptidase
MNDRSRPDVLSVAAGLLLVATAAPNPMARAAQPAPSPGGITLDQVLGAPFPSGLVASPDGGKLAWISTARGVRSVWVAEPPEYKGRPLAISTEDDGEEITDLLFASDGRTLVFVRGGGPNSKGEIPNPRSRPEARERAVWVVSTEGGAARRLAEGHSPVVHPTAARIAFVRKSEVYSVDANGGEPERLFQARGEIGSLRISPDGARLAFVSGRGDHDFVGVFEAATKTVRYLDPSLDHDGEPVWSPDGKRLAFRRIPSSKELFTFGPRREGEPWSIRVADVATGAGREVWRADKGRGSVFREIVAPDQIFWAAGDRLVFPWEKTGWTQLYAVPAAGGAAVPLTSGECEVEHVALGADRQTVLFSSNQGDIDRRHVGSVRVGGGAQTAITSGTGLEWSPVATSDGKAVAFLAADARRPAHPAIKIGGAARDLAPGSVPSDFPESKLVVPEAVVFPAADGLPIHAQLFRPAGLRAGERRPAVVFFHGGSRRQMLLGWHYMDYYHNAYAMNQYLASRGYLVLSVNYRSGIGYGMEFREATGYGAHGAAEFADVVGAGLYLRGRSDVEPAAIGLWGGSYGGYLTALGLARASDLFAAGVDIHGVHDWNVVIKNFAPTYDPEKQPDLARRAFESSPLASVKNWRSPVLLIHGDDDRNVPFSESVDLAEALRRQGVAFEQLVFPDEAHDILVHARWIEAYAAAADFFDRKLQPGGTRAPAAPSAR